MMLSEVVPALCLILDSLYTHLLSPAQCRTQHYSWKQLEMFVFHLLTSISSGSQVIKLSFWVKHRILHIPSFVFSHNQLLAAANTDLPGNTNVLNAGTVVSFL